MDCPICLSLLGKEYVLGCGHGFHKVCIQGWFAKHDSCPMCRKSVTLDKFVDVVGHESEKENVDALFDYLERAKVMFDYLNKKLPKDLEILAEFEEVFLIQLIKIGYLKKRYPDCSSIKEIIMVLNAWIEVIKIIRDRS